MTEQQLKVIEEQKEENQKILDELNSQMLNEVEIDEKLILDRLKFELNL